MEESNDNKNSKIWQDPRFAHLVNDPRFKNLPKKTRKVKIDKRFQSMFQDKKFKVKYTADKYGRKVNNSTSEDLKKYYELSSGEESDADQIEDTKPKKKNKLKKSTKPSIAKDENDNQEQEEDVSSEGSDFDEDQNDKLESGSLTKKVKKQLQNLNLDYARGGANLATDSSSDDETTDDEDPELFIEHVWGEFDRDAPTTEDATRRLAACNMDWDSIKAIDIIVLCNSFLPPNGTILNVSIYPSEYGKERLAEEDLNGPAELRELAKEDNFDDEDKDDPNASEGSKYQIEKLRQYQINRLKYYYAVITCDSVSTAEKLYQECDGLEYESTATKLDLRFIPEDMKFDDEPVDECNELPDLNKYKPRLFTTSALQEVKVNLTWDDTSVDRKEVNEKMALGKFDEVSDADLRKYVAYSSEEEEVVDENKSDDDASSNEEVSKEDSIQKYQLLLNEIKEKENEKKSKAIEMEFSWGIGMDDKDSGKKIVASAKAELTPFEQLLDKKKQKRKIKKEERKKSRNGDMDNDNLVSSDDDLPDGIDMNDPYFAEEFNNDEFAKPNVKQSKKSQKKEKLKQKIEEENEEKQKNNELALLLDDTDDKAHFSLKKIQDAENETKTKRKKKLKKNRKQIETEKSQDIDDGFELNVNDNRFAAIYSSHLYNIDPTDSHYKKTKGMENIIQEKLKRRTADDPIIEDDIQMKKPRKDVAVHMMVKNIKRKINQQ